MKLNHSGRPTFNCILNPDSIIRATLTESRRLDSEGDFVTIEGAEIILSEEGVAVGIMQDDKKGNYSLNYKPKPGATYEVTVITDKYPAITAQTIVPNGVRVEFAGETSLSIPGWYLLEIKIKDTPGRNYYWFYTYTINKELNQKYISNIYSIYAPFFDDFNKTTDPEIDFGYYYNYMIRINDKMNDGNILSWETHSRNGDRYDFYKIVLEADEHYDKYLKTSIQSRMLGNQVVPVHEPVPVYSNVVNGYGIFGANIVTVHHN